MKHNYKIGDRVKVIGNTDPRHNIDIGDACTITGTNGFFPGYGDIQIEDECGCEQSVCLADVEPITTTRFQIGQRYTQVNGREVTCIALRDDGGMWAVSEAQSTAAYAWDKDGNYLACLPGTGDNWKIIFPPVIETVRIPFHTEHGNVYLSYQTKDGVPDWSSAEVVE